LAQISAPKSVCFQSAALPRCEAFVLTEFGGGVRVASNRADSRASLFQWNLGAMKNVSRKAAVGGSAFFTWSESDNAMGIQPRVRYWANPKLSFDVAPGLIVFQGGARLLGFNGVLAANLGPTVALTTTLQITDAGEFQGNRRLRRAEWFIGARLGGKVGAVTALAAPLLTFLTFLITYSQISD
jgi:hypothetical protein